MKTRRKTGRRKTQEKREKTEDRCAARQKKLDKKKRGRLKRSKGIKVYRSKGLKV
jgi:hypothetical protein